MAISSRRVGSVEQPQRTRALATRPRTRSHARVPLTMPSLRSRPMLSTLLALALVASAVFAPQHALAASAAGSMEARMGIVNTHRSVMLDPSVQHIPLDAADTQLRPPPARVPRTFDIFIGLSVFRDGYRCGYTMFTGFKRAKNPDRIHFGVVDQVNAGDKKCIDEFCAMSAREWPEHGACRFKDQIRVDERLADDSRGPTLARHYQQKLLRNEEFCLQLDGHSIFTNLWDEHLVSEWKRIDNEMAVLTTYLHHVHDYVTEDGENNPPNSLPHLCTTIRGGNGLVRNEGASMIGDSKFPQLSALWGAGLSFSKCHAERRVLVDSHTLWMFDGEEFLRSSHLWTYGYDLYSPSKLGSVVYHNYSRVPARFENVKVDFSKKAVEMERSRNRFNLIVGKPFVGQVDALEMDKFAYGPVRPFADYLKFSGVTFDENKNDTDTCHQLHWVPYKNATEVEQIVGGGWKLRPTKPTDEVKARDERQPVHLDEPVEPLAVEKHAETGAGGDEEKVNSNFRQDLQNRLPQAGNGGAVLFLFFFVAVLFIALSNDGMSRTIRRAFRLKDSASNK